jgi:hypothetical protein
MINFKYFRGFVETKGSIVDLNPAVTLNLPPLPIPRAIEPIMQNRFLLTFPPEFGIASYYIREVGGLSFTIQNNQRTWNDLEVSMFDPVNPSLSQRLMNLVNGDNVYQRFQMILQKLGPIGEVVCQYQIYGGVRNIHFGFLSYESSDLSSLTLTIRIDHAELIF